MSSRKLLAFDIFYLISTLFFIPTTNLSFDFSSFTLRNLTLFGDAYLRDGVIGLTRELGVPSSSSGTAIFNNPIPFFDPESATTASFSTRFSFSMTNVNSNTHGDGLAFFLATDNETLGSPGGYLGLVNMSQLTQNKFIAVEFDTRMDAHFGDPNGNHVGLDIESLNSVKLVDPMLQGVDLKSGNVITAWIEYNANKGNLKVFLSYSGLKPGKPILDLDFDLSGYLKELSYVGFSASTEGSTELHLIKNWSLETFGLHARNISVRSIDPRVLTIKNHHKKLGLGFEIAGPGFFVIAFVLFGYLFLNKRMGLKIETNVVTNPREFTYRQLKSATRGFHSSRILGYGAFGTVYKAVFVSDASVSAVKRSKHSHEGKTEFLAELSIIACLRHKNLVPLQGWCVEKGELMLVYEFMENGSLDKHLHQADSELGWSKRFNIAVGLASVLTYLHQECEQQVIHRDIKSSNIMLDGVFNARLGDFGLAKLMDHDKSPVSTLTAGTMGYLAPEYLQFGKATEKTDVYSYGVVILELASGKQPIEKEEDKMVNLIDWVWALHGERKLMDAADKRLNGNFVEEEMKKLLLVGLSCANPDCMERPSMRRVFQILNNEADVALVPRNKPSLSFSSMPMNLEDLVSDSEECKSVNPSPLYEIIVSEAS